MFDVFLIPVDVAKSRCASFHRNHLAPEFRFLESSFFTLVPANIKQHVRKLVKPPNQMRELRYILFGHPVSTCVTPAFMPSQELGHVLWVYTLSQSQKKQWHAIEHSNEHKQESDPGLHGIHWHAH